VVGKNGDLNARLEIQDVRKEPEIKVPDTLEFLPQEATGRPGRRNNIVLYVNADKIPAGSWVTIEIRRNPKPKGKIRLFDADSTLCEKFQTKLGSQHLVEGQNVFRVLVPWTGTSKGQRAQIEANSKGLTALANLHVDESDDGGFFKDVKYEEIDPLAPSQFAAGVITVNINDPLNRYVFGDSKDEFDERLTTQVEAQQRLAGLLLEEASFRALQQLYDDNKVIFRERAEIGAVHEQIDKYKFESAVDVYKALTKDRR